MVACQLGSLKSFLDATFVFTEFSCLVHSKKNDILKNSCLPIQGRIHAKFLPNLEDSCGVSWAGLSKVANHLI